MTDIDVDALEALQLCADRFDEYAASHSAKGTMEGCAKAARNAEMAGMCKGVIARAQAAPAPDDVREAVTLADCPPGLFLFNGSLGFKTVCGAMRGAIIPGGKVKWEVTHWPDAYCVESGDNFWGGAITHEDRAQLMVQPIADAAIAAMRGREAA